MPLARAAPPAPGRPVSVGSGWRRDAGPVLAALLFAVAAGATRSRHPTFDAWLYSMHVESVVRLEGSLREPQLWHPHHLIYEPLGVVLVRLVRAVAPSAAALDVLQSLSVAAAAVVLLALGRMIARAEIGRGATPGAPAETRLGAPFFAPLLLGATFAFWYYAGEAEVYLPALAGVAAAMLVLTRPRTRGRELMAAAALLAVATLFHQMVVLLAPALLLWFARWRRETRAGTTLVAAWAGLVLIAYATAWWVAARRAPEAAGGFWSWVTYYLHAPMREALGWGHPRATAPLAALVGLARALLGGHAAVALDPGVTDVLRKLLPGAFLEQEFGIVHGMPRALAWGVAAAGAAAGYFWVRAATRATRRRSPEETDGLAPLLGLWGVTIAAFTLWWEPDNLEFWLLALPGCLGWVLLRERRRLQGRPAWAWLLLAAAATFGGSIVPKAWGPGADTLALFARAARLPAGTDGGRLWARFGEPYLPGQVFAPLWKMSWSPQEELAADIAAARQRVWVLPDSVAARAARLPGRRIDSCRGWLVWVLSGAVSP